MFGFVPSQSACQIRIPILISAMPHYSWGANTLTESIPISGSAWIALTKIKFYLYIICIWNSISIISYHKYFAFGLIVNLCNTWEGSVLYLLFSFINFLFDYGTIRLTKSCWTSQLKQNTYKMRKCLTYMYVSFIFDFCEKGLKFENFKLLTYLFNLLLIFNIKFFLF